MSFMCRQKQCLRKERKKEVVELLERFNLAALSQRHPQSLSGGQKQRLVIASSIVKRPEILILDEPTSGLDGANMQLISQMMKALAEEGVAVLVISHDLELISTCCTHQLNLPPKSRVKREPHAPPNHHAMNGTKEKNSTEKTVH